MIVLLCLLLTITGFCQECRPPYVSGSFYPAEKETLSKMVGSLLAAVPPLKQPPGKIVALISPHAGYIYSGQTAAYGYKLIEGMSFDTVIILGPYHKANFPGVSIWDTGCWETPLGTVPVDTDLARAIISENKRFAYSQAIQLKEHSIEMELPFLQTVLKNFKIVPILISTPSLDDAQLLARAIYKNIQGKNVLLIASTDMSHYYPDQTARTMDTLALDLLQKENSAGLLNEQKLKKVELCGMEATVTLLEIAKLMGNTHLQVLNYSNSGDSPAGNKERVVGYGSSVIYQTLSLSTQEKQTLLNIASSTLTTFVNEGKIPSFSTSDPALLQKQAVFVTLRKNGALRGCIGRLTPTEPLYLAVRNMTVESASKDPRFKPVRPDELADIKIEISIIGPLQRINSADDIILGKHGVIVKKDGHSGVFLPSVAAETGWTKEEFLRHLCQDKANLPANCWLDPTTQLYIFTTYDFKN